MRRLCAGGACPIRVRSAYCPNPTCQSSAYCWPVATVPPNSSPRGNPIADAASAKTRWLLPAGEGRPTTALTTASSDPSPFGPHPCAPGTANASSPWTPPVIKSDPSAPFKSGAPVGSKVKKPPMLIAFDRSVFEGLSRIGSWSEPMKQLGPSNGFSRWILIGIVMIGTPVWIPANRLKFDGRHADWVTAVTTPTGVLGIWTGSATSASVAESPTTVNSEVFGSNSIPTCRLVFPVVEVMVPIVMLPCVEFEPRQNTIELIPSLASIAGSSTGQRKNGAHAPGPAWNSWSAPVVVPAELVATTRKW